MPEFDPLVRKRDGRQLRYLVVDDSVFARKNLQRILAMFGGCVAGEADNGRAAIEAYDRLRPDVVLMDVTMPEVEGIEAADRITSNDPAARIVMVSSVGYQENIAESLRRGARYFVQKPPKPEELYEVIKRVLGEDAATAPAH
ncbi:MAG TPA: response regulator [Terriglobia bacterium]|nr:response regulator [Terriglobia bacterium]